MDYNRKTLDTYNQTAKEYARLNNGNKKMQEYHHRFKQYVTKGFVYDIGCGTGRDVHALRELGFEVIGIDGSKEMLKTAKECYPKESFLYANLLTDIESLKTADGLWACASLLHFRQAEFQHVFPLLLQKLKTNGVMYLSLKLKDTLSSEVINGRYFAYYTKRFLDEFFQKKSLQILYYEESKHLDNRFANYFLRKKETGE